MKKQRRGAHRFWPICLLPLALLVACAEEVGPSAAPIPHKPPLPKGGSVFFVGNSFFNWEGRSLPEWVAALGKAEGIPFKVDGDIVPGDQRLAEFLRHEAVRRALASKEYQVWILQGHELEPVDHLPEFKQAVRDFHAAVAASGGQTMLFMTWEFRWRKFLPRLAGAYESIGRELDVPVIPVGLIYRDCGRSPPKGRGPFFLTASKEYPEGDLHEDAFGSAVNAYATFAMLTGRNPRGEAFDAAGYDLSPGMASYLSDRTWARVAPRLEALRPPPEEGR